MRKWWLVGMAMAFAQPAWAQAPAAAAAATVASPNGRLRVTLGTDGDGRPHYSVSRGERTIIAPSALGFLFADAPKLQRNLRIERQTVRSVDTSWEQPWGEWKTIRDRHNELKVRLKETTALGRVVDMVFRVFDDGVGFRYELPDQPNLKTANIQDELTEFALAEDGTAWWTPGGEWNRYEYLYETTPISGIAQAHTPLTVRLATGEHVAFHEAALVDYSGMWLRRVEGTRLKAVLAPGARAAKVTRETPFVTPWRTMIITDDAPGLYMSHVMLNLNEPNRLGDVSWVNPTKYVGVWWEMHLNRSTWATGAKHGATTENVKRYIDFAAANGFGGVLVEGWNVGWDGQWFGNGNDFDFARPTADFDIDALVAYAKRKGVRLVGHHETGGGVANYERQLEAAYRYAADKGIEAVKTGYVTDAGQIERVGPGGEPLREWHDGQYMVNHHLRVVQTAAKHRIAVNAHEPVKDTGLRRTYPNWISREGARGQEYQAWGTPKNPPEHEPILVFTRMLSGPMDFTPGLVSLEGVDGSPIPSTLARQLAQYVVIYSPVQMAADLPENYAKYPQALRFIRDVPVDWADSRVLNGAIGDYVTIARKDRGSEDWYLGSVTDENGRGFDIPLDFLTPGRRYEAQFYRDGEGADFRTEERHAMTVEKRIVRAGDTIALKLAPGGGAAVRLRALD